MSWHHYFPLIDDQFLEAFQQEDEVPASETQWLEVDEVFPPAPKERLTRRVTPSLRPGVAITNHLLCHALPSWEASAEPAEQVTLAEVQQEEASLGSPEGSYWSRHLSPLLRNLPYLLRDFPSLSVRVYLPQNLSCLVELLTGIGCEVHRMKHSSCGPLESSFWKYLACDEKDTPVTFLNVENSLKPSASKSASFLDKKPPTLSRLIPSQNPNQFHSLQRKKRDGFQ